MAANGSTESPARDAGDAAPEGVSCVTQRSVGVVTLHRPQTLNAITPAMCGALDRAMRAWTRDAAIYAAVLLSGHPRVFSAGADVRAALDAARHGPEAANTDLRAEYRLNWLLECFPKPCVALIDGLVMGSGNGWTLFGTHRVAGDDYAFAVPECRLGLVPDVGQAFVLGRLPDEIGTYLALTGRRIGRADAFRLGLVTHVIPAAGFAAIVAGLADADPVDPLLDGLHVDPGAGELPGLRDLIGHCFAGATLAAICERLAGWQGVQRELAQAMAADIGRASPMALKATLRHVRTARQLDVRQTLMQDMRVSSRLLRRPDVAEGARVLFVDKGAEPNWQPARLTDVTEPEVDALFQPLGADELVLPPRAQLQSGQLSARV